MESGEIVTYRSYDRLIKNAGAWGSGNRDQEVQVFERIQQEYANLPYFFEDDTFKGDQEDLGFAGSPNTTGILREPFFLRPHVRLRGDPPFHVSHFAQGYIGDCWMLSALAAVTSDLDTMRMIVPERNPELDSEDFSGAVQIRLCHEGEWECGVVDFKLLVANDDFVGCRPVNEDNDLVLWPLLFEKYLSAKIFERRYGLRALDGGYMCEAYTLLTEGTTLTLRTFEESPTDCLHLMEHIFKSKGFASCSTEGVGASPHQNSQLTYGHAYTVMGVFYIDVMPNNVALDNGYKQILVKIKDPHSAGEPKYPFSKKWDCLWKRVSHEQKHLLGYETLVAGEFFLTFNHFVRLFELIQICHAGLPPATPGKYRKDNILSEVFTLKSCWEPSYSAGGSKTFYNSYHTNPRLFFNVPKTEGRNACCVWVRLIHRGQRQNYADDENYEQFSYGFDVYKLGSQDTIVDKKFLKKNPIFEAKLDFLSQNSAMLTLREGKYVVLPYTENPGVRADFALKVVVENQACLRCTNERNPHWEWIEERLAMFGGKREDAETSSISKKQRRSRHDVLLKSRRRNWV